ncbi:hypothetical protein [Fervidibacter sacchari]
MPTYVELTHLIVVEDEETANKIASLFSIYSDMIFTKMKQEIRDRNIDVKIREYRTNIRKGENIGIRVHYYKGWLEELCKLLEGSPKVKDKVHKTTILRQRYRDASKIFGHKIRNMKELMNACINLVGEYSEVVKNRRY